MLEGMDMQPSHAWKPSFETSTTTRPGRSGCNALLWSNQSGNAHLTPMVIWCNMYKYKHTYCLSLYTIYLSIYLSIHPSIHPFIYIYIYIFTSIHLYIYTSIDLYIYTSIDICLYIYICLCIYIYIYTHASKFLCMWFNPFTSYYACHECVRKSAAQQCATWPVALFTFEWWIFVL